MTASPFDSPLYAKLFGDAQVGRLFTDSAAVRAMLIVEGALARAQGAAGVIPETSAAFIHRAAMEVQIDPAGLADETGQSAVCVPALVGAFRHAMEAPEHARHLHYGATSQDIMDTGLTLRLRQVVAIYDTRLRALTGALGQLAQTHAHTPMAARTYAQVATVTSFGAVVAGWGAPLPRLLDQLEALRPDLLSISLSGAAGTLSAMGPEGPAIRAAMAQALKLTDPGESWHANRDRIAGFSAWMTLTATALGKMGEDLTLLAQSEVGEVTLKGAGGSSTMPQKTNPVMPSLLVALARQIVALNSAVQGAAIHRQQRDGAAWMVEWMSLPQICIALGRALEVATELARTLSPRPERMAEGIDDGRGLIYAEALSFALAEPLGRPEAQAGVKALCQQIMAEGGALQSLALDRWPDHAELIPPVFDPVAQLGTAPGEALAFAENARALAVKPQ